VETTFLTPEIGKTGATGRSEGEEVRKGRWRKTTQLVVKEKARKSRRGHRTLIPRGAPNRRPIGKEAGLREKR